MYCMYSMYKCMCESLCTLVCLCRSSYWLLLSLRIPLKSQLSLSSQPSNRPFCRSFSLPCYCFPSLFSPWTFSLLVSFPASLFSQLVYPSVSPLHVLLSVPLYLSLPVSFSVSGPCLVNLEVSLCPSLPPAHPPSMDKHIGRGGRPSGGAANSVPLPPPRSGQCNTQMDEFPIHPPPAGSPRGRADTAKLTSASTFTYFWFEFK